MKRVITYLVTLLLGYIWSLTFILRGLLPQWLTIRQQAVLCILAGGFGGVIYCLRGIYLSACVRKDWGTVWLPWYFIRPVVSLCCGLVAYFFMKAGLLILDATSSPNEQFFGFYALAFIAGYNVDKFLSKIEQLAHAAWGIEKSRSANSDSNGGAAQ
jgi:hypothetical protein